MNKLKKLREKGWLPTLVSSSIFLLLAAYACSGWVWPEENSVLSVLRHGQNHDMKEWMRIFSDMGRGRFLLPLAACPLLYLIARKDWRCALFLVACDGASLLNPLLKVMFHRVRPVLPNGHVADWNYGFPSGHATLSSALFLGVSYIAWRYYKQGKMKSWVLAVIAVTGISFCLTIGFSRIYLQAHYPTDVLGGWLSSIAWVSCMRVLFLGPKATEPAPMESLLNNEEKAEEKGTEYASPLKVLV